MLGQRMLQIDEHHHAEFGRDARERDEADPGRDREVIAEQVEEPDPAGQRERQGRHDEQRFVEAFESQVEQHEDDGERGRHHHLEPRIGALQIFELPRVRDADAGFELHLFEHRVLQVVRDRGQVASAHIHIDPARQARVLAFEHRRPVGERERRHHAERDLLAHGRDDGQRAQALGCVAQFARIAQIDRIPCQAFDGLADVLAADHTRDHRLHIGNVEAVARGRRAVDLHVEVASAGQALGQRRTHARHRLGHALDVARDAVDRGEVGARDLDPDRAFDAGGQHVDAVADRRNPDVGQARHLDRGVERFDQFLGRHAGPPLFARLQLDRGLEHFERCRIGRGLGAAGLAEHARNFRHGADHAVGLLQQLGRLGRRQTRQRRRHVEQIAFVERRQEFAAQAARRPPGTREHEHGHHQRGARPAQHRVERGPISADQHPADRVLVFIGNAPANPCTHEYRNQRDGEARGSRHRISLGVSQRPEQPAFLRFEREHRHEGQGDDEQAEEQRRPDLDRGLGHELPMFFAFERAARMRVLPGFEFLVRVLDHHHRGIDHRTDRNRNAAERHQVGIDALALHHDESDQHPDRQ